MGKNANVDFEVNNQIQFISEPSTGINFVEGITVRGPHADPKDIISNWPQFVRLFGGLHPTDRFPSLCKRMLEGGARLRVNRLGHYTDIADRDTLDATVASMKPSQLLELDADLVADNTVAVTINPNGTGDVTVDAVFNTDTLTTLQDLATALELEASIQNASASVNGVIIVPAEDFDVVFSNPVVTGGVSQAVATLTPKVGITDSKGNLLFTLSLKYAGADYNNFVARVSAASNGNANYFNLELLNTQDSSISERYENLTIPGSPAIVDSNYLNKINTQSPTFKAEYQNLSAITSPINPVPVTINFTGGSDGSALVATDYIGDSNSKTGFYAFDAYDDAYQIFVPTADETMAGLHAAGFAYAEQRDDIHYWAHLNHELSKTALLAAKDALNINSKMGAFFTGGLEVIDPRDSTKIKVSELADTAVLAANSDDNFGVHYSFAGLTRGRYTNVLGIAGANYGSPASTDDMQDLANHQINTTVNRSGSTYLWNLYSASLDNDPEKFLNIGRLLLYIKKSLRPTLESFLEDPNDIPTWKAIYFTVKPFIQSLLDTRAVERAEWQGDQFATSTDDANLQVNTAAGVLQGKYKVRFKIKPIGPMKEISVEINLIDGVGVTFDLAE